MPLTQFIERLNNEPAEIQFSETMAVIDALYDFTPTDFTNGAVENLAGTNNGSCKILAFGQLQGLSKEQTLSCFGDYYRIDVLGNPSGDDHANIRNFILHGWDKVSFKGQPLIEKR
ncbi:HopJ type III effector protein [Vibrio sp. WXL103]|uniref:HopJ type III effector protein n=1 Tax=unclassified Vibrio TaxID=2614977 RepID=UPI003EC6B81D